MPTFVPHWHCPRGCDKPQPLDCNDGEPPLCQACWFRDGQVVRCVACTPDVCDDADW